MATGTLKFFNHALGYGVIAPDEVPQDLLVYVTGVEPCNLYDLMDGHRVRFDLQADEGQPKVVNLMLASTWLEWRPEFGIGIHIDEQHKDMIACYVTLVKSLHPERSTVGFQRAFCELLDCSREHFSQEERVMRNIGFKEYEGHKAEHKKLTRDAEDFGFSIRTAFNARECSAVAKWFRHWLINHIQQHDLQIERFLHREG